MKRNIRRRNRGLKGVLVLGLGNPMLSDDSVGLYIIDLLSKKYPESSPVVTFSKNYSGGMDLIYELEGFEKAIIVDSIFTGSFEPGFCHEFSVDDLNINSKLGLINSHGLNLPTVLEFGEKCGYCMPEIVIYGIEGREFTEFSENPTEFVINGLESSIGEIERRLDEMLAEVASENE
ncbi:MAG: hydrogenase maturation protease [Candidatus Krumholzibacteriota bacterium]|nr:hydrogenase maturation protease [Candidatus Krumholzibacteriota bacterium]